MKGIKRTFRYNMISWLPVLIWMSCIFYVSSYPTAQVTSSAQQEFVLKKFAHILEYGILAALTYRGLRRSGVNSTQAGMWAILFVFFYGCTDEFHERFVTGRESRFRDVLIDVVGGTLSILIIWKLLPKIPKKLTTWAHKLEIL